MYVHIHSVHHPTSLCMLFRASSEKKNKKKKLIRGRKSFLKFPAIKIDFFSLLWGAITRWWNKLSLYLRSFKRSLHLTRIVKTRHRMWTVQRRHHTMLSGSSVMRFLLLRDDNGSASVLSRCPAMSTEASALDCASSRQKRRNRSHISSTTLITCRFTSLYIINDSGSVESGSAVVVTNDYCLEVIAARLYHRYHHCYSTLLQFLRSQSWSMIFTFDGRLHVLVSDDVDPVDMASSESRHL